MTTPTPTPTLTSTGSPVAEVGKQGGKQEGGVAVGSEKGKGLEGGTMDFTA